MVNDISIEEILRSRLAHLFDKVDPTHFNDLHGFVISETEKALFTIVLEKTNGNQLAASRLLGVNRNTLRKKLTEYKLSPTQKSL